MTVINRNIENLQVQALTDAEILALDMTGITNQLAFNTTFNKYYTWNGETWKPIDGVIERASDSTEFTTFSTTGVAYLNLFKTGLVTGKTYGVKGFYIWNHDGINQDFWLEVRNFGSLIFPRRHQQEPKDAGGGGGGGSNQAYYTSFQGRTNAQAGQIAIDLFFGTTIASQESTIFYAEIELFEL